jgi:hypothetical protein
VVEVVIIPEEAMQVVGAKEICSPSQRIDSLLVNCVEGLINWCSSAIRDLILFTWEKRSRQMLHTRMELIPIGIQTRGN